MDPMGYIFSFQRLLQRPVFIVLWRSCKPTSVCSCMVKQRELWFLTLFLGVRSQAGTKCAGVISNDMNWKSMEMLQCCCILQIATLDSTKRLVNYTPAKNTLSHSANFFTQKKDATGNYESSHLSKGCDQISPTLDFLKGSFINASYSRAVEPNL